VYVDNKDIVWLSDFGANAVLCCTRTYECRVRRKRRSGRDYVNATINFDGLTEEFSKPNTSRNASVRQIFGRPGEVWLPESGADKLVVIRE